MSKRLQVLLDKTEYQKFFQVAKAKGMSLGEWVRQAMRRSYEDTSGVSSEIKIKKINELAKKYSFPSGSIEEINEQIKSGYLKK